MTLTKAISLRAVHLDLKGVPPTPNHLASLPRLFSAAGYNAIVVEWEDMFPWTVDRRFRHPSACYTTEEIRQFTDAVEREQLELIPLVQCLGHMENVLSIPGYEALRELPDQADVLNPLAEGATELIGEMVEDLLRLLPQVRWLHLGGDEAWTFGQHPDTQAFIAKHGKGSLYLKHVEPLMSLLHQRGIRPLLWHDMMTDWTSDELHRLAGQADVVVWGYQGHPDDSQGHYRTAYVKRLHDHGLRLWGGAAFKGADGADAERPDLARRMENAAAWFELSQQLDFHGLIATGWSRYAAHRGQCETLEASLDALFIVGHIFNGQLAKDAETSALAALQQTPYFNLFQAAREAAAWLSRAHRRAWDLVRQTRQQAHQERRCPSKRCSTTGQQLMELLHAAVDDVGEAGGHLQDVLHETVCEDALKEYVAERYETLAEEAAVAQAMLQITDHDASAGTSNSTKHMVRPSI